ncbi:MAG: hypothetical protein BAJALOKI2v1_150008 [Promethearchaeota archaeon]|nr:MAG: hypothetical protein BAJALOKI2v1_150008 [Candidatus Lokiarchaeota archaeon]
MGYEEYKNNIDNEQKQEDCSEESVSDYEGERLDSLNIPSTRVEDKEAEIDIDQSIDHANSEKAILNEKIKNPVSNIDSVKGFEIISESITDKVYQIFGKNSLLSILYQVGAGPGNQIAERIIKQYNKSEFEILECLEILMNELKEFYSIQIRKIERTDDKIRIEIGNHCFLRDPFKDREKLRFGKAFCRVNKGYFETAFKKLLGNQIKKVEINFLQNDPENDVCIEELIFHKTY